MFSDFAFIQLVFKFSLVCDLHKKASLVKGLFQNPLVMILKDGDHQRDSMKTPMPSILRLDFDGYQVTLNSRRKPISTVASNLLNKSIKFADVKSQTFTL